MQIWTVDADNIRDLSHFHEKLLLRTPAISSFLDMQRDTHNFVVATKGVGKTFLLTAKRKLYQDRGVPCLPETSLRDVFTGDIIFDKKTVTLLKSNIPNWTTIWGLSISLAILSKFDINIDSSLKVSQHAYSAREKRPAVSDFFYKVLGEITQHRQLFYEFQKEYSKEIIPLVSRINSPIAVFIDKVDEYFYKHIERNGSGEAQSMGEVDPDIWVYSQMGLVHAIYDLARLNHHFKLFASIRKEAVDMARSAPLHNQYRGVSIELKYTRRELRDMFVKYIQNDESDNMVPGVRREQDPLLAFLGVQHFMHRYVGRPEDTFDYIYRHTFERPRDLMLIGRKISEIEPVSRNEDRLKRQIDSETLHISKEYLEKEVYPYITDFRFDDVLGMLDSNILTERRVKSLCGTYNGVECGGGPCRDCDKTHVFCSLYRLGLLGVVGNDGALNEKVQRFIRPGEKTFAYETVLPKSAYYLLHPVLYARRFELGGRFAISTKNIVGQGLKWNVAKLTLQKKGVSGGTKRLPEAFEAEARKLESDFIEIIAEHLTDLTEFDHRDPPVGTSGIRSDIRDAMSTIFGEERLTILDLGCGEGPLVQALSGLDPNQLKSLTYVGWNFGDVDPVKKLIRTTGFGEKVRKYHVFERDAIDFINVAADYVFLIDVVHHLNPAELDRVIRKAVQSLKLHGNFVVLETEKEREEDTFLISHTELKSLFAGFDFLKIFATPGTAFAGKRQMTATRAHVKRIAEGQIEGDFKTRCLSLYEGRLRDTVSEIEAVKHQPGERDRAARLLLVQHGVVRKIAEANKYWSNSE